MIIENALIMNIMKTENGIDITREMVERSLGCFVNAPIVHNPQGEFKNYRDENMDNYKDRTYPIGIVLEPIRIENDGVYARINIWDKYKDLWRGKYDNWCIILSEDKKSFIVDSIEVF